MKKTLLIVFALLLLSSCGRKKTEETPDNASKPRTEATRWIVEEKLVSDTIAVNNVRMVKRYLYLSSTDDIKTLKFIEVGQVTFDRIEVGTILYEQGKPDQDTNQ